MKTITDIKPQIKNSKRVSIFLDNEYYCGLDLLTTIKYRLKVGSQIDEQNLIKIQREAELNSCFEYSLKILGTAIKTEKQIKDKLILKGYLEEIVVEVIEKLKSYKYLDDEDYAKRYINTYSKTKGSKLMKMELIKKGVSSSILDNIVFDEEKEEDACYKLGEKYMKNKEKSIKNRLKCYSYLLSKGFSYEESKNVSSKLNDIQD